MLGVQPDTYGSDLCQLGILLLEERTGDRVVRSNRLDISLVVHDDEEVSDVRP